MSAPDDHSLALPPLRWGLAGLRSEAAPKLRWLWHGYLAVGSVTLLTSQWKIGKTTLLSILLARMKAGGTLAGLPVSAGRAVVISEDRLLLPALSRPTQPSTMAGSPRLRCRGRCRARRVPGGDRSLGLLLPWQKRK